MKKQKRILVVGGNAAGPAAAAKAKRVNPSASVKLFEKGAFISTGTCEIPYVLSGKIDNWEKIVYFSPGEFHTSKGVEVFVNHYVSNINRKEKYIEVENSETGEISKEYYDALILSTGSKVNKIPLLPDYLSNVFYLKSVGDLISCKEFIGKNKPVNAVVIGSGYIGIELAEALKKSGMKVTVLEKMNLPLPGAEEEISRLLVETLRKNNISFYGNFDSPHFRIEDNYLNEISFSEYRFQTDIVFCSVGVRPETELAIKCGLETGSSGGIKVDPLLRTSDSYIYAAGDNIEVKNLITGKPDYIPQATLAHIQGHIAGENAAGGIRKFDPVFGNVSVKIFDEFYSSVGLTSHRLDQLGINYSSVSAEATDIISVMPGSRNVFGKLLFEKPSGRILGAAFFGSNVISGYADLLSSLISENQTPEKLEKIIFNYTPPLSPFIHLLSIIGRKYSESK